MLKPSELKNYEFKQAGRNAYKAEDVDSFMGEVTVSYEKMFNENRELIKRINLLADKLEQYKNDGIDIKQAVLSAQKAADIIVRDAEASVADIKQEAEAVLAAAKGEAEVIKTDAEKQAIADSDLLLSMAKEKAEDIINKAKDKAHGILIAANDSASDTVGAANRTITSESLHYDMLKKEVSDFRASILAQYKEHIELISKLPQLAEDEAKKIAEDSENTIDDEDIASELNEIEEQIDNPPAEQSDDALEYIEIDGDDLKISSSTEEETVNDEALENEEVVKTELPYDFFGDSNEIEFVDEEEKNTSDDVITIDEFDVTDNLKSDDLDANDNFEKKDTVVNENQESDIDIILHTDDNQNDDGAVYFSNNGVNNEDLIEDDADSGDVDSNSVFFDAIQNIDVDDEEEEEETPAHSGFFRKKKNRR